MTKNEFKQGDKVTLKDDTTSVGVIRFAGKESCIVDFGLGDSTTDYKDIVPLDRRTAFLTRLQSLLREFDASFDFYDVYDMEIRIGEESVEYGFLNKENSPSLNADNIMDFDKE